MGLIDRIRGREQRDNLTPTPTFSNFGALVDYLNFNGVQYPLAGLNQSLTGTKEPIGGDFAGLAAGALKGNPVVYACMAARSNLFSEARFMYRQLRSGTPGDLFSLPELEVLRHPWPGGTTSDLLARTMQDNDLAGNAFWLRRPDRLVRLRPDWVMVLYGSHSDPKADMWDPEAELVGYAYQPGGPAGGQDPVFYQPALVAHVVLGLPDPLAPARGLSWLSSLIREVEADSAMTSHKYAYLMNGATPNLVVVGVPGESKEKYQEWVDRFSSGHDGVRNAYRSLYLTPGMDAKVLGNDLAQVDFKKVQGLGETRIAAAAGVPAAVVGISEGLAGSSLNAGNFQSSMRRFADLTMRPAWRNACGSFEQIIRVPVASELWYDDRDIPALKDDIKDYAEVQALQSQAIRQYVDAGYEPASVVDAVNSGDLKRLKHTGLFSVQLQPPGTTTPEPTPVPLAPVPEPPKRDAVLLQLLDASERRAIAAENRTEPPTPVFNVHASPVTVNTPEQPVTVTIERGAVEVPITVEPAHVTVNTPEVRNEITVDPTPIEVSVEPTPIEVRNDISVEPTPVEITNEVSVEPTPVSITNEIPEQRTVTKTIVRDPKGLITEIREEPTDG